MFIRRGLFANSLSKSKAGLEKWTKMAGHEDESGAFGLEEYI